ncbi:hypothetical protein [Bacteroides sp.]|uniref:hypothetical protein n=1 Tax=Bacteroides sp. TaxID=29523 RepID=UPI0025BE59BF|nr:hypothetical protein [Bacteroides sp.]
MQPTGNKRIIHSFKGIRIRQTRKLIGNAEKKKFIRGRKDRTIDRAMKRGEKHLYKKYLTQSIQEQE